MATRRPLGARLGRFQSRGASGTPPGRRMGDSGAGIARADGLDAPWYQLGAEGIAVPGVVGDQTEPGRYRPSFPLGFRYCRGADRPSGTGLRDGLADPI